MKSFFNGSQQLMNPVEEFYDITITKLDGPPR